MRYGYFDDERQEYVITRPDTPTSWINYLGTADYAALVSNNASGYSFYKSPRLGRLLRFRFNSVPLDRPGRYIYLRDEDTGDYWSATWQPVGKPLDHFSTECRHGMGYTRFVSCYDGIETAYRVSVPIDKPVEIWDLEVTNSSDRPRALSVFAYAEWCLWISDQDLSNFQYILYTCRMDYADDVVDYSIMLWPPNSPKGFLASVEPVVSFDTNREAFIGPYHDEGRPAALEAGRCANSIAVGGNPCAAVQNRILLQPGERRRLVYIIGVGDARTFGQDCKRIYADPANLLATYQAIEEYWQKRLGSYRCETPSELANTMVNVWNAYQCHTTFNWSRSASFDEAGGRDGLGYRDSNQDSLSVVHAIPDQVRQRLCDLMKGQLSGGYALHGFQPLTWKQGPHNRRSLDHTFSDDHLWLLLSVPAYLKETGDMAFLDELAPFADEGSATIYEHLQRALEFSWEQRGPHGFLYGLAADWNDCINLKGGGESTWSTFLYYRALSEMIRLARRLGRESDAAHYAVYADAIRQSLEQHAWDGDWFLRGYLASGDKLGAQESEGSKIFLNAQTWAVISGAFEGDSRAVAAMSSAHDLLATEHGLVLNYPAFRQVNESIGAITAFPAGLKENGSIFCHTNTWAVVAEALLGHGDQAFAYYLAYLPADKNETADRYAGPPYVYSQFITGKEHPFDFGRAHNPWLTGTAAWSYVAISQYILGVRAEYDGLLVSPAIPQSWDGYRITRQFRGRRLHITVENPEHVCSGVRSCTLSGEALPGNLIPFDRMQAENQVRVVLGQP